jgi:predicted aldo/keto reductase-like oxidoreductase
MLRGLWPAPLDSAEEVVVVLYRKLGKSGPDVSVLGFGAMRLPLLTDDPTAIDQELTTRMIRDAIDAGVNYVDTAYPYHGNSLTEPGASEGAVGLALEDGYRERVHVATKLPSWLIHTRGDMDRYLEGQLERLGTGYIDCYLLHAINDAYWENLEGLGVASFLDAAIADGRIRYAGFSYHHDLSTFKRVVDVYDWTFAQIQYNFLDVDYQAGERGLRYAAARGLGVIVMEPLKGGRLAGRVPNDVAAEWRKAAVSRTPAEWALRWVWNDADVSMLLSGMSTAEQLAENLRIANAGQPDSLSDDELDLVERVRDVYRSHLVAECTQCKYCMPCPVGVDIPNCIRALNLARLYDDIEAARKWYATIPVKASACTQCGSCEDRCPQGTAISDVLEECAQLFGE